MISSSAQASAGMAGSLSAVDGPAARPAGWGTAPRARRRGRTAPGPAGSSRYRRAGRPRGRPRAASSSAVSARTRQMSEEAPRTGSVRTSVSGWPSTMSRSRSSRQRKATRRSSRVIGDLVDVAFSASSKPIACRPPGSMTASATSRAWASSADRSRPPGGVADAVAR